MTRHFLLEVDLTDFGRERASCRPQLNGIASCCGRREIVANYTICVPDIAKAEGAEVVEILVGRGR